MTHLGAGPHPCFPGDPVSSHHMHSAQRHVVLTNQLAMITGSVVCGYFILYALIGRLAMAGGLGVLGTFTVAATLAGNYWNRHLLAKHFLAMGTSAMILWDSMLSGPIEGHHYFFIITTMALVSLFEAGKIRSLLSCIVWPASAWALLSATRFGASFGFTAIYEPSNMIALTNSVSVIILAPLIMHRVISTYQHFETAIAQASKMATIGELASDVVHEINNPISIIQGYALQLRTKSNEDQVDSTTVGVIADKIVHTVSRVTRIITTLQSFARIDSSGDMNDTNLHNISSYVKELAGKRLKDREVHLEFIGSWDQPVYCNETAIGQALVNLVHNAADAVASKASPWIKISWSFHESDFIAIRVIDCGNGIPADIRDKLMQPFFTTKERGKGTGLGLSIARRLAARHRGDLTIDSECPNTCFVLTIPYKKTEAEQTKPPVAA